MGWKRYSVCGVVIALRRPKSQRDEREGRVKPYRFRVITTGISMSVTRIWKSHSGKKWRRGELAMKPIIIDNSRIGPRTFCRVSEEAEYSPGVNEAERTSSSKETAQSLRSVLSARLKDQAAEWLT